MVTEATAEVFATAAAAAAAAVEAAAEAAAAAVVLVGLRRNNFGNNRYVWESGIMLAF